MRYKIEMLVVKMASDDPEDENVEEGTDLVVDLPEDFPTREAAWERLVELEKIAIAIGE